jgi:hypothetical protein
MISGLIIVIYLKVYWRLSSRHMLRFGMSEQGSSTPVEVAKATEPPEQCRAPPRRGQARSRGGI